MNLIDAKQMDHWQVINDSVMGGHSTSQITVANGIILFRGYLSFQNKGGFASARYLLCKSIVAKNKVSISVKGNCRRFQLRLRTDTDSNAIAYKVEFVATDAWQKFTFTKDDFKATFRGRYVSAAQILNFDDIKQISFLIADKCSEVFALEIASIDFF